MPVSDEQKLYDDPKYRSYAAQIEKALKNFEYSTEWADLISALVKLNKVLLSNTSFEYLPKRITIGKRLSQCLHPALPGGVHIKGLEVYDTIFKIIGKKRLELDLHIYGAGIFSLLANASMLVRPVLLNVYETHLLPLGERLRSSLDGMLLGLLPGLEEGSEHFDRITLLLEKIAKSVGLQYFYSSLWRAVLCSPSGSIVRLAAAQLVLRQFDKKKMTDDQLYLIGLDVDVMVHALCEALQDENVLTQRATLDILVYCFPLSSLPVSRSDIQQIMCSAVNILLRRDMSLNRRLYSWLMGTDLAKSSSNTSSVEASARHFEKFSREILTSAISNTILSNTSTFESVCCMETMNLVAGSEVRLLRIVISLLDKSDIGPVILDDILDGILRLIEIAARKYKYVLSPDTSCKKCRPTNSAKESCSRAQAEYVKLVNLFVNTFETEYAWNMFGEKFVSACARHEEKLENGHGQEPDSSCFTIMEICNIVEMMLEVVSIETSVEIQTVHLPELLSKIFEQLKLGCDCLVESDVAACLVLSMKILKYIQPIQNASPHHNNVQLKSPIISCVTFFQSFVVSFISKKIIVQHNSMVHFSEELQKSVSDLITNTGMAIVPNNTVNGFNSKIRFKSNGELNDVVLKAFQDSCRLLIDISCFPTLARPHNISETDEINTKNDGLPDWMLSLMACSCFRQHTIGTDSLPSGDMEYFYAIRMTSCSTILELLAVTQSNNQKRDAAQLDNDDRSVVAVVVPAPLNDTQIKWIFQNTDFIRRVGEIFWEELIDVSPAKNSLRQAWSMSRVLISLHELCPDETIERLMLRDLLSVDQNTRVVAIKKFTKLWHYMKDGSANRKKQKNFSRCLFAVLDQLIVDRYTLFPHLMTAVNVDKGQSLASTTVSVWLRQALEEGGLARILEPYILIALEESTHRKSLQRFLQDNQGANAKVDLVENFTRKHAENMQDTTCANCAESQMNFDEGTLTWTRYHDFSVDSVMSVSLCEVHNQIAKERHSYEHLVGLLTLSDDIGTPSKFRSTLNSAEDDLNSWAGGFVRMLIAQAVNIYKSELGHSGDADFAAEKMSNILDGAAIAKDEEESSRCSSVSQATEAIELNQSFMMNENPLYSHVLIYQESFDANCILYGLQGILNMASAQPSVFIYSACTTSLSSSESSYSNLVQELLIRHERSIEQGRSFYEATPPSLRGAMKNRMLIEVLISICLYYLRSAFQNETKSQEIDMNHEIHTVSAKLLKFMMKELRNLAQQDTTSNKGPKLSSSTKQFSAYIVLVLQRQQVQSVVLTCLLTTIFALKNHGKSLEDGQSVSNFSGMNIPLNFDEEALHFSRSDHLVECYLGSDLLHITTMFSHFLELIFELVTLEHYAFAKDQKVKGQSAEEVSGSGGSPIVMSKKRGSLVKPTLKRSHRLFSHLLSASHQYDSDLPLASQKVFVSTILEIYRLENHLPLHQECSISLNSVLPCLGSALSATVVPVLLQQCLNLENVAKLISQGSCPSIPPSYLENTISSIVKLCHYCLLSESGSGAEKQSPDSSQSDSISLISAKTTQSVASSSIGAGLSTLLNVFSTSNTNKNSSVSNDLERSDGVFTAKIAVLNNLARIVSCMCNLWKDVVNTESKSFLSNEELKGVSYTILQLLGPLAIRYGEYLLVAFSLVWQDREMEKLPPGSTKSNSLASFTRPNSCLEHVIDLMMAIKLLSTEMYFSLVKQVIKNPPPTTNEHKDVSLHESILQMLLYYMRRLKPAILLENWTGFLLILQEALALGLAQNNQSSLNQENPISPSCYFLMMYLLSEYVKRSIVFSGKKEQKELQDVVTKCVEACNVIAGSSLEQGTWIRRNVSVLPGPQAPESSVKTHKKTESQSSFDLTDFPSSDPSNETQLQASSSDTLVSVIGQQTLQDVKEVDEVRPDIARERPNSLPQVSKPSINPLNFRNSVKALTVLSEVVANLLDVVYNSEEKEKIAPILMSIMANVTPYLRNHSKDNTPSFSACVSFVSSISGFQYTRRAWRKDVIDLFLDGLFFHMPPECISDWRNIVDNLMTHDKLTFKEIMSRTSLSKPGASTPTLSIFSNKEQELELRAMHIKRLAFIVFSSETDQYQKQLPEIQERLAESLKLSNIPGVQCRVFLCFRVLLLRISPHSLTSLWPTIFTELVHAMMQLEQALQPSFNGEGKKTKLKTKSSKHSPLSPGDRKTVMTCWHDMYLAACKLLDLILCLPSHVVPQFQLYKWSFIGDISASPVRSNSPKNNFQYSHNGRRTPTETSEDCNKEEAEEPCFVPHCVRIQRLFNDLYPARRDKVLNIVPEKPLLSITRLKSLDQLQLFFNTITSPAFLLKVQDQSASSKTSSKLDSTLTSQWTMPLVERVLEKDFVRAMV